eukprot:160302-Pelagomonas_calceolata.AAC.1
MRSTARISKHNELYPGPPRTRALAGAVATRQQRQLRGKELLGCPGRHSGRALVWANQCIPFPSEYAQTIDRAQRCDKWAGLCARQKHLLLSNKSGSIGVIML